ncbi:pyruvate dehydrogenase E1 component [Vulcanimicrobium alpinum]|uniref:Pyruvate dehydrogenase E1 component n=1 Tax=Vulcanimicrobium alpinum TaxID=3016050 RepID=A0AAN1XTM8_UNVUL|nr:pyruvate dehydrogenase (acetyl-transferring), homodimeric type [Vulcanimicrobium alpinum]BDE05433.1 pyruvate dehydrogenase E1 component [Vulcanimicrobium alpinum]
MIDTPLPPVSAADGASSAPAARPDPDETREWLDALDGVIETEGAGRASELVRALVERAATRGVRTPAAQTTPYVNTIAAFQQGHFPGDHDIEERLRHYVRWNAMAMVVRANRDHSELGGHVATFSSAATLYDIGFNHFWRGPNHASGGDLVYFQGHSSPGVYARAFLEGRISEEQVENFRREVDGKGVPSYPHPWLMPDFWQFATVSMGLGPLQAVYQARYMRYMRDRGFIDPADRKVWGFLGDGEIDEPETLAGLAIAAREKLDNLIFVVNCNLQRLDGPVRGNGKVIQELEGIFRGAGWNVIKTIWGSKWDPLLEADGTGMLVKLMGETLDGDYQTYKSRDGAYVREHFFGRYPETRALVERMSDDEVWALNRGGHDPVKVYAAYKAATEHRGAPTVILAKTIKGYGMGSAGEGMNIAHQQKKLMLEQLRFFRDRFSIPISDKDLENVPLIKPAPDSREAEYLRERVAKLGSVPTRRRNVEAPLAVPQRDAFAALHESTGEREISTTMAFVRTLSTILRDKTVGPRVVPIVADESRTFGMEGMFRQLGIYSAVGQLYRPQDADQLMWYREDKAGQILQEGISEAGAMCSWIASGTSYSTNGVQTLPFYIFYSMFGFQRIGDFAWAAGDMRTRGFLLGGTSGRTTLNGEGLQHEDGHAHLFAASIPNCMPYDPTFGYEVATIVQDGVRRMLAEQEDVYYYLSLLNENYQHPAMPAGAEDGILRGMYLLRDGGAQGKGQPRVQLMGSGAILREVIAAGDLLRDDFGVVADVWSCTSFTMLHRDGESAARWNLLHPTEEPRRAFVSQQLDGHAGPVIAATDYVKTFAEQIRPFVERRFHALGTDGFGRSDTRKQLRSFFEVDRRWIALAALKTLADEGTIDRAKVADAIARYGIDPAKPEPTTV